MGYRSCLGLMRLSRHHGRSRLEQACQRALLLAVCSYPSIKSILESKLETQPVPATPVAAVALVTHDNLRGSHYYQ
jgi:hypothetical protein